MKNIYNKGKALAIGTISVMNLNNHDNKKTLDDALKNNNEMDSYLSIMTDEEKINQILSTYDRKEKKDEANRLERTVENIKLNPRYLVRRIYWVSSTIAAAILLISFAIWENNIENHEVVTINNKIEFNNHQFNKPLLINEKGTHIVLDDTVKNIKDAKIVGENYIDYTKTSGEQNIKDNKVADIKEISYNTIKTPSQYTYTVKLSDGSEVTLNANSSIRFPNEFYEDERVVYLHGEAYFNIKKSKNQFIVKLENNISIKVYGTQFNINTNIGNKMETLLINGEIGVKIGQDEVILKPLHMISVDSNKKYKLSEVDASKCIGWKSGRFICNLNEMGRLMSDISQWYGVEFQFCKDIDLRKKVIIHLDRYEDINDLIDVLERAYNIRFIKDCKNLYYVEQLK